MQSILDEMPADQARGELDAGLSIAMPKNSLAAIQLLLQYGANLDHDSFRAALTREEIAVFQLLLDCGWDINWSPSRLNCL
jgi:hypothetical protein